MVITDTRVIERTTAGLKQALPYVIHQGGTSSGKTYGNCYAIISHLLYEKKKEKLTVSIVSINFPHLRKGAMRDFENIILDCGLSYLIEHNKSNHTFKFPNGSVVEFFSVDSYEKALGLRRDILFINECNSIAYDVFFQLSIRTRKTIILDYNPTSKFWFQEKLLPTLKPSDYIYTRTTYRDNKALSDVIRKRIESIQDDYLRQVYVEGRTGKIEGLIFTKYTIVDEFPNDAKQVGYGLDFGFSIDPTALVKCGVLDGCLYIEELIYEKGLLNRDLAKKMKEHGISQSTNIWCDNQPNTVFELKKVFFYNAKIVKKGADSILAGLDTMKQFKICIVKGSNGAIKEFENYKWETKRGESTGKPIDDYNHCFVGETLIDTDKGKVPIKNIKVGDLVLTSKGFNKVLTKFNNGKRQVNLYKIQLDTIFIFIKCTDNHKIKTSKGWIQIKELQKGTKVYLRNNLTVKPTTYIKTKDTTQKVLNGCIELFGNTIMNQYKKVSTFTTLMELQRIIELKTCNLWKVGNTLLWKVKTGLKKIQYGLKIFMQKGLKPQKIGTNQKRVLNGIDNTQSIVILETKRMEKESAKFVQKKLQRNHQNKDFVQITAKQNTDVTTKLTTSHELVLVAETDLQQGNIQSKGIVQEVAVLKIELVKSDICEVYDLMVENEHEYFANGLLVHNCIDAVRYFAKGNLMRNRFNKDRTGQTSFTL